MNKDLLPEQLANRLAKYSILSKSKRLGHHKGSHRSRKTGSSLDFSDFREYHPGDDLRYIDWNVYARTEKPFIKQFLDEQEMRVHILLDPTKSMGTDEKWIFARQLAIALGQIGLKSGDTVSFSTWSDTRDHFFRKKGAAYRAALANTIVKITEPVATDDFTDQALRHIPKAVTVLFIITDGLEEIEKWAHLFKRLPGVCRDVRIITVHSRGEEQPTDEGDIRYIDIETAVEVEVTVTRRTIRQYMDTKKTHEANFVSLAAKYGIGLLRCEVSVGIMDTVTKKMRHIGWLR